MKILSLFLLFVSVLSVAPAFADRDIVYAARYYAPPGSHRTSRFHLYRINPNGTGKTQLTFGSADEYDPQWSPDGRRILFTRDTEGVCVMEANGGRAHLLLSLMRDGMGLTLTWWSADSRTVLIRYYVRTASGDEAKACRIDVGTGRRLAGPASETSQSYRLDYDDKTDQQFLSVRVGQGWEKRRLRVPADTGNPGSDDRLCTTGDGGLETDAQGKLIYALNNHNSTVGVDWLFYRLAPAAGVLTYLTEGQFLTWSSDKTRFCTAPGRDTTPYEKRKYPFGVQKNASAEEITEAENRLVWTAPLYVRAAAGGPKRALTPRLSWVIDADWRRAK